MPLARKERKGAAWSPTILSNPSRITRNTSRRRIIIFCPKKDTSPCLSLKRSWFTEPTSRRRSQAVGRFWLGCNLGCLPEFPYQRLCSLADLMSEGRVRIINHENRPGQIVDHVYLKLESGQEL